MGLGKIAKGTARVARAARKAAEKNKAQTTGEMSAAERAQIAGMSNFNTPNYNSPYDQFNFFSNMVGGGGGGGKGMGRPAPQMAGGLAPFMMGMFR